MGGPYLPLLICGGECLEWSEGSDRLSGEWERLLRRLSCDRLEWSEAREWISEMSGQREITVQWPHTHTSESELCPSVAEPKHLTPLSPSLSEAFAEGMLSSRSGMFSNVALSSLWTTIFSLPFDLSISFLASIKERFSVTVPLIWENQKDIISVLNGKEHLTSVLKLKLNHKLNLKKIYSSLNHWRRVKLIFTICLFVSRSPSLSLSPSPSAQHPLPGCCRPWLPGSLGKCPWQRCGWPGAGHILLTKWTTATKLMLAQSLQEIHTWLSNAAPTGIKDYLLFYLDLLALTWIFAVDGKFSLLWQLTNPDLEAVFS